MAVEHINSVGAGETRRLTIKETNPLLDPRWESFVMLHPAATIYHHPAWLAALNSEYQQESVYLICENSEGALVGIFPLIYTRGIPFSKGRPLAEARLASLPRTPVAGPLTTDPLATVLLLEEAVRRAAVKRVRLQIKTETNELNGLVDAIVAKPWRMTYLLHLPGYSGEPFRVSHSQNWAGIKRAIKKASANGLRTRPAETERDLAVWYACYLETMRRNVVPARPYRFFLALWQLMRPIGLMQLLLAEHSNGAEARIVAGYIFFRFGKTVTYAFGASRTRDLGLRPNDMILWQAIDDANRNGFDIVDLGEVPEGDEGLIRFKTKWGAEPARLYRYYSPDFPDSQGSSESKESVFVQRAKLLWQHLPLIVTAWLGDQIYGWL
jgi:CelD/BcsL family acetyltransferase involved in cellulose biosynthesis